MVVPTNTEQLRSPFLLSGAVVLLLAYVALTSLAAWYRLRHIKGPFLASFSYLWLIQNSAGGRQAEGFRAVNDKYGPLARIGPNDLLTNDPEMFRRMGKTNRKPAYSRSSWYSAIKLDPYHESLISKLDTHAHDQLKAQLSFGYAGKENPSLAEGIDSQIEALVDLIRRKYISKDADTKPLDLATVIQYFTLDALTKVAYGYAFGYSATDSDVHDYIKETEKVVPMIRLAAEIPWAGKILTSPTFLKLAGPKTTDKKGFGKMLKIAADIVEARFEPGAKDQQDMLGAFIRHGLGKRDCQSEIPFQIVAGSDTTATAVRGTLLNLMTAPNAYYRLQKEIDEAVADGRASSPIQVAEARNLPYLQAVLYEGLRINIPFSGLATKIVPPGGDTINGQFVPGGTRIGQNFLGVQRSKEVFGDDPDLFRPERWLNIDDAKLSKQRHHVELVFGAGRWGCGGKTVALIEMNKIYFELSLGKLNLTPTRRKLLRRFDFQLINPMKPIESMNQNMFFQKNMWVRVTERFPMAPSGV
ncbi:hypothetical protein jhhlp_008768 [Lomentospora prolificans]|uniref:Cytochrome P450 monooxygenase ABA1 n=1 Tax=Lomentospora prolificans TaxID=41688 RepID=A0A2N3MYZ1_9PEZI|nr:hypothetical protein jhhlp_008768 [Lomentospora prolificans]